MSITFKSLTSKENKDQFIYWINHPTVCISEKNNAFVGGFFGINIKYFMKIKPQTTFAFQCTLFFFLFTRSFPVLSQDFSY